MSCKITLVFFICSLLLFNMGSGHLSASNLKKDRAIREFNDFVRNFEAKVIPLTKNTALASFEASISGKEEDYSRSAQLQIQLMKIYSDRQAFNRLREWKKSDHFENPLLRRQLDILYFAYLGNQIDEKKLEELVKMQTEIEKKFNTFRPSVNGKMVSDNQVEQILKQSTDSNELEKAWKASKKIGQVVNQDVIQLVKLRNRCARELGFGNYHQMQLKLTEQDPVSIEKLFDKLDLLTKQAFKEEKDKIDAFLSRRLGIKNENLKPWHYQNRFFQDAPQIYSVDLNGYYRDKDLVTVTGNYYKSIGLPVNDVISRSDLYEKPGKYQHAFCTDIDRHGDVRILCNVKSNSTWMNTLLHEFGHAVYAKFNDRSIPWILRDAAHSFTTEAIANLFGRFASNPVWLEKVMGISKAERIKISQDSFNSLRLEQLVFSRWSQVMYRFEKSMYENPEQDLNRLWWDLVEKYQLLKRPEERNLPDWASKIHVALYPAYYHNYLLGELLASQLYHYISSQILKSKDIYNESFFKQKEVGKYLVEKVFKPGMIRHWNDMIKKATGEKLTPVYYVRQFVTGK